MIITLQEVASTAAFQWLLVFCRIGSAIMVLPGFGEIYVAPRARLLFSLLLSFLLMPLLSTLLPPLPVNVFALFLIVGGEIIVGLFIGALARALQSILHVAGMIIAFQSSLAAALLFDVNQGSQGSVFGNFLTIMGITLLFVSGLHHLLLEGVVESYAIFIPGEALPWDDFAETFSMVLSESFLVAIKIASPHIIVGLLLYIGSGVMSRLMPTMQVFFILMPLQILMSFYILIFTLSATMLWYLHYVDSAYSKYFLL